MNTKTELDIKIASSKVSEMYSNTRIDLVYAMLDNAKKRM